MSSATERSASGRRSTRATDVATVGVNAGYYAWRDLEEAIGRAVDEFGVDLVEFDESRLRDEEYPSLGLLSQRFGVALALRLPSEVATESAAIDLTGLSRRCEEGLIDLVIVSRPSSDGDARIERAVSELLPACASIGVQLCLECYRPSDLQRLFGAAGCVPLAGDDWAAGLDEWQGRHVAGPFLFRFSERPDLGYREAARLLRATVGA